MKRISAVGKALEDKFVQQFATAGSVSLLVGLACNLAFIGQVFFWPAMWHTSVFMISYTDASYFGQLLCACVLIVYFKKTNRITMHPWVIWVSAFLVQLTLILYYFLMTNQIPIADPIHWFFGALFGIYLPISLVSWVVLFIGLNPSRIMWNIMLSAIFASFVIWVFSGLDGLKICTCMGILILSATAILSHKLKENASPTTLFESAEPRREYSYSASAMFLFSVAFVIAISFAGVEGEHASFATGAFFAPMLIICVLLLFVDKVGVALSNVAAPAIVMATIATSSLHFDPALTFDIAALGMFLFLAFAVVLLCSSAFSTTQKQIHEFLLLMVAFSSGCLIGRITAALCTAFTGSYASDILILISIVAAFAAMIILIRKGVTQQKTQQLLNAEDTKPPILDDETIRQNKIEALAAKYGLGERETEVFTLLLEGDSASDIARKLIIANGTAKSHIRHVYKKLGIHNRTELFELVSPPQNAPKEQDGLCERT